MPRPVSMAVPYVGRPQPVLQNFVKPLKGPQISPKAVINLGLPCTLRQAAASLALVAVILGSQHSLSQVPPSPAVATTNRRPLCRSYLVALGQHRPWLTLTCTGPIPRCPTANIPSIWLQSTVPLAPQKTQPSPRVDLMGTRAPLTNPTLWGLPPTQHLISCSIGHSSQPVSPRINPSH